MKPIILVTGSSGFLGSYICNALSDALYSVIGLSRKDCDFTNYNEVKSLFDRYKYFDFVIHTAIVGGTRGEEDGTKIYIENLAIFENLFVFRHNYGRFINIGSGAEFGKRLNNYGKSKLEIFKRLFLYDNFYHIRCFNVFSWNEKATRLIRYTISSVLNNHPVIILEDKLIDCFYIEDFVKVISYFLSVDDPPREYDCVYETKNKASTIAQKIISFRPAYNENIKVITESDEHYIGNYIDIGVRFLGLERGLLSTFKICEHQ